jgi:hypothetical protein
LVIVAATLNQEKRARATARVLDFRLAGRRLRVAGLHQRREFLWFWTLVNAVGNIMFLGLAIFTAVVCFVAWRRGNRAAGCASNAQH